MNSKIIQLPSEIAEKIAAGEVVERPFSVVKELIENSLDAKASRIEIFIEEGGKNLIQIQDDGIGMHPEEIHLALQRHATSKLRTFEDLYSLATLGFRGEALPSIASISRFSIKSRSKENSQISGYEISLDGGKIVCEQDVGHPIGTTVTVESLFFNVPARLKFLKSTSTEWSHIEDYITSMALAYPQVQWIVHHNKKEKIRFVQIELSRRMIEVWGSDLAENFYPINYERGEMRLSGYIGHPNLSHSPSKSGYLFLNGRPVKDRVMNHAVIAGYRSLLMKEQFPTVVLFLEIPSAIVDVNVHPAKREVRFANPNVIHQFMSESIRDFLSRNPWKIASSFSNPQSSNNLDPLYDPENKPRTESLVPSNEILVDNVLPRRDKIEYREKIGDSIRGFLDQQPTSYPLEANFNRQNQRLSNPEFNSSSISSHIVSPSLSESTNVMEVVRTEQESFFKAGRLPFSSLKVIGQLKDTYILCESDNNLVLIDQHAAHERIGFEKLRKAYHGNLLKSQKLLIPQLLEVKESEKEILQPHLALLEKLGLEIEEFGSNTLVIKSTPAVLGEMEVFPLVRALIVDLEKHGSSERIEDQLDDVFATMACHNQIRAGDALSHLEMKELIAQLDEGAYSYHCPHGRPVMVQLSYREIEKWFKRIV